MIDVDYSFSRKKCCFCPNAAVKCPGGTFIVGNIYNIGTLCERHGFLFARYDEDIVSDLDRKYVEAYRNHEIQTNTVKIKGASTHVNEILDSFHFVADNTEELTLTIPFGPLIC